MKDSNAFEIVGANCYEPDERIIPKLGIMDRSKEYPVISIIIFGLIVLFCVFSEIIMTHDPTYLNVSNFAKAPNAEFYFGTDMLGRDIFSMIWYGGRISLFIGIVATVVATAIAIIYGSISGLSEAWVDDVMMRITEILLSIPSILLIIFVQSILGQTNVVSIAIVIGATNWMNIAKIIRSETRQIRNLDYVLASKTMGSSFFYRLRVHLIPNFVSSIMFMVVMNVSSAIGTEATLSFLGIGLPIEVISWGSMLSNADKALLSNYWWIILIPGIFLVLTLVTLTDIGNYIRRKNNSGL